MNKSILATFAVLGLLFVNAPVFADSTQPSASLDVTVPLGTIAAVTPNSSPSEIAEALQARFDYLMDKGIQGRVFVPAGTWVIDRPIFIKGDARELDGAGLGKTIIKAADGSQAMPMINVAVRDLPDRPIQTVNRPVLTDETDPILDSSVSTPRYGVRTYTEYPHSKDNHIATGNGKAVGAWASGVAYKVDDVVRIPPGYDAVCVQSHTSNTDNRPWGQGDWKDDWVLRLPFNMQFFGDPLSTGPLIPSAKRSSNWANVPQVTFDFAFTLNADPALYNEERPLIAAIDNNCDDPKLHVFALRINQTGELSWDMTLANGASKRFILASACRLPGLYRIAIQTDFAKGTFESWVRKPGEPNFTRTNADSTSLPPNIALGSLNYGYLVCGGGNSGTASMTNGNTEPPTDITICGLHESSVLRYSNTAALTSRIGNGATTDQTRYFTSDPGTIAFLPLTDNPDEADLRNLGRLITVEHGDAAGDPGQRGYGYLMVPQGTWGVIADRVCDMTIAPGPVWGAGIICWNTLDPRFWNLDIHGGYWAIGDLFMGAQYTIDVRNCQLSGSDAAYAGMSDCVLLKNCTISPVGRCGVLLSGSNGILEDVNFEDPVTHHSEYYYCGLCTTLYGGMNTLRRVTNVAPAGSLYPSRAGFSMTNIWVFASTMVMEDCRFENFGPQSSVIELPYLAGKQHNVLLVKNTIYAGNRIASFVHSCSDIWTGAVVDADPKSPVDAWMVQSPPPFPAWTAGKAYKTGEQVVFGSKGWTAAMENIASVSNQPGAAGAPGLWLPAVSNIAFSFK